MGNNVLFSNLEYIRQTKEDIMKSPYYQKLAALVAEVEKVYRELTEADATTNIKKYYGMLKTFVQAKIKEINEFGKMKKNF